MQSYLQKCSLPTWIAQMLITERLRNVQPGRLGIPRGNKLAPLEIKLRSQCVSSVHRIGGLGRDVTWAGRVGLRQWPRVRGRRIREETRSAAPFSRARSPSVGKVSFFPTRLAQTPEPRHLIPAQVWTRDLRSPAQPGLPSVQAAWGRRGLACGPGRGLGFAGG